MRNNTTVTLTLCSMLALAGCATTDDVLFVTKTSLGIDFDAKPASASIAYDRTEGYIAPRYDNGEIPPVVASIRSDGAIFSPKIKQVYATGDAAVIAVSQCPKSTLAALDPMNPPRAVPPATIKCPTVATRTQPYTQKKLKGKKKLMFFGTTTTTGLKVGFTSYVPDSFVFGFKRKEYSFIPLGTKRIYEAEGANKDSCSTVCASWNEEKGETQGCSCVLKEEYDVYPSVLASIDTAANAGELKQPDNSESDGGVPDPDNQTSLSNAQYFATGRAARELAANEAVSDAFQKLAAESLSLGAEKQKKKVKEEDEKIEQIVAFYAEPSGSLKKNSGGTSTLWDEKITELGESNPPKISRKKIDHYKGLKNAKQLKEALDNDFPGLGKPVCDSLANNCK